MYELKKNGKVFTSKSVGTGPWSYEKKNLPGRDLTKVEKHCSIHISDVQSDNYRLMAIEVLTVLRELEKAQLFVSFWNSSLAPSVGSILPVWIIGYVGLKKASRL